MYKNLFYTKYNSFFFISFLRNYKYLFFYKYNFNNLIVNKFIINSKNNPINFSKNYNTIFYKTLANKNHFIFKLNKTFFNLIFNLNVNFFKYLVLDNNKYFYNLYTNMFSINNLLIYKHYFFLNPAHFTHKNFIYFYNQFLINNQINFIFIFDLKKIIKYSHILDSLDIVFFTFNNGFNIFKNSYNIPINTKTNLYLYFFIFNINWILFLNYNSYKNKIQYINIFNKIY